MKILLMNNRFDEAINSGAERIVKTLFDELVKRGHEVSVLTAKPKAHRPYWLRFIFHVFGAINLAQYLRVRNFIREKNPDLVWTHNISEFGLVALLALGSSKKLHTFHDIQLLHPSGLLLWKHENMLNFPAAFLYQRLANLYFPKDAYGIFPSQWLRDLHAKYRVASSSRSLVIRNALREYGPVEKKAHSGFSFLYMGQIEAHKGLSELIEALRLVDMPCKLRIAGTGSLLDQLKKSSLDSRIEFLGQVTDPEKVISESDCVVVPSLCYENSPTAILEAISQHTPVIASYLGGSAELLTDKQLLFLPEAKQIAETMNWCLANKEELCNIFQQKSPASPNLDEYLNLIGSAVGVSF